MGCFCAAICDSCYMNERSQPKPRVLPSSAAQMPSKFSLAFRLYTNSSQTLARGLLHRAHPRSHVRRGTPRRDVVRRLVLLRRSLALGEEVCGAIARAGQGGAGPETREGACGVCRARDWGGGAIPARAEVRGGSALFTSPRNVLCKHFPLSRGQAPRGCRRT